MGFMIFLEAALEEILKKTILRSVGLPYFANFELEQLHVTRLTSNLEASA
jgi:hypothetical protein